MIYPVVEKEKWIALYDIDASPANCENCGKLLIPEIPFAYKNWRGLMSAPHECGEKYNLLNIVSIDKKVRQNWVAIYNTLKKSN